MVAAAALMGALVAGLVALYLTRPRYEDIELSAARFFDDVNEPEETSVQFRLSNLLLSPPFYLQLAVLLALLAALLRPEQTIATADKLEGVGVWIALDTSASMSATQSGATRMEWARRETEELLNHLRLFEGSDLRCLGMSTFDLALTTQIPAGNVADVEQFVADVAPRPLGTDLTLLRRLASFLSAREEGACQITHLVVVTDAPFPEWGADLENNVYVLWRDIGEPVENVGVVDVRQRGDGLFGSTPVIDVTVAAYGSGPARADIAVQNGAGVSVAGEALQWEQPGRQQFSFIPPAAGQYHIQLSPGGSYGYDDDITISVGEMQQVRVDWKLPERSLVQQLGWIDDGADPHVRVAPYPAAIDGAPTLLVGDGYGSGSRAAEIDFFLEASPLLSDLNFDVAERLPINGVTLPPDSLLRPVLTVASGAGEGQGGVWLAASEEPLAAYVPGLPGDAGDANLYAFSTTVFFNALRWLLQERTPPPLFTLTTPEEPLPDGARLALHPGEGNTALPAVSEGQWDDIQPAAAGEAESPLWPIWLALAALFFTLERGLASLGGPRWR